MYDTIKNGENTIVGFEALFKLKVLIPEWVCQEVKPNRGCASFKESVVSCVSKDVKAKQKGRFSLR